LLLVTNASSASTLQSASAAESTSLVGLLRAPALRPGAAIVPAHHPRGSSMYTSSIASIATSPMARLAIRAIEANQQMRDMSMKAEDGEVDSVKAVEDELMGMDGGSKAEVEKMAEAVKLKAEDMPGVTGPMGFFDPLGFTTDCPTGKLLFYREVELKHGRVAMLAALGILVAEQFHPLFGGNIDLPAYITFQFTPLQQFWYAVVAAIAIPEIFSVFTFKGPESDPPALWQIKEDRDPGNFNFDPLGLKPTDPKELRIMQDKELNNGRLAMIAAAGMIAQELVTNRKLFDTSF